MSSAGSLAEHRKQFGPYELLAKLATGGMAEIYLAQRSAGWGPERAASPVGMPPSMSPAPSARDLLVIKRILPHLADDDHFVTMFRDEATLAARIEHPNVCRVHHFGQTDGAWYIAMEYLHGVPLSRMMSLLAKRHEQPSVRIVAGIILAACAGLHHAHELVDDNGHPLGVVHRDVSPPNIMVTAAGTVKLLDFGIAKAVTTNSTTRTGTIKGKNAYMAPEQILGQPLDRRSDIFALGTVMYELLTIKRLFHRESDFLTFKAITEEAIADIRTKRSDLPPGLPSALMQALARDPSARFASARAFGEAIEEAMRPLGGAATEAELSAYLQAEFADELASADIGALRRRPNTPSPGIPLGNLASADTPRAGIRVARSSQQLGDLAPRAASPVATPLEPRPVSPQPGLPLRAGSLETGPIPDLRDERRKVWLGGLLLALGGGSLAVFLATRTTATPPAAEASAPVAPVVVVSPTAPQPSESAAPSRADIVALSKFGFVSVRSNKPTVLFLNDKRIGETPISRVPIAPGIYKAKLVASDGHVQKQEVTVYGGQDADLGIIAW